MDHQRPSRFWSGVRVAPNGPATVLSTRRPGCPLLRTDSSRRSSPWPSCPDCSSPRSRRAPTTRPTDRYIVTTTSDRVTPTAVDNAEDAGGEVVHEYAEVLSGFSAELTPAEVAEVRADPRVEQVVKDGRVRASANQVSRPLGAGPTRPAVAAAGPRVRLRPDRGGRDRVRHRQRDPGCAHPVRGPGAVVGIRFDNGPVDTNTSDCAGHGTHVAGIIGGLDVRGGQGSPLRSRSGCSTAVAAVGTAT